MRGFTTPKRLDGSIPSSSFDRLIVCIQRQGLQKAPHLRPQAWLLLLGCLQPQHDDFVQAARSEEAKNLYSKYHSLAKETDTAAAVYANMVSLLGCLFNVTDTPTDVFAAVIEASTKTLSWLEDRFYSILDSHGVHMMFVWPSSISHPAIFICH